MDARNKIYSKETPFEIFTPYEMTTMLTSVAEKSLRDAIRFTTTMMNQGMHHKEIGWYKKLEGCVLQAEKKLGECSELKEVSKGAEIYLTAANRLQAPRDGRFLFYVGANGEEKANLVHVYKGFWDDCLSAIPCFFAANLAERYQDSGSVDGKEKSYLYTLLHLKIFSFKHIDEEENNRIKTKLDIAIRAICKTAKLPSTFFLDEKEMSLAQSYVNDLEKKGDAVIALRQLFESEPLAAKYVHIRPVVPIQFAQALIFLRQLIEENTPKSLIAPLVGEKKNSAIEIIDQKCREIASVMAFQEMLLARYKIDDFIELLHDTIGSFHTNIFANLFRGAGPCAPDKTQLAAQKKLSDALITVLPSSLFFTFERQQKIRVIEYDCENPPKEVAYQDRSVWRKQFVEKYNVPASANEKKSAMISSKQSSLLSGTQLIYAVSKLEPLVIQVPAFIISNLLQLPENYPDISASIIFDFFVTKNPARRKILEDLQHYKQNWEKEIDAMLKQVEEKASHSALFESHGAAPRTRHSLFKADLTCKTKQQFSAIAAGIGIFEDVFKERDEVELAITNANGHEKFCFLKYLTYLDEMRTEFQMKCSEILTYWKNYIAANKQSRAAQSQMELLNDYINRVQGVQKYKLVKA